MSTITGNHRMGAFMQRVCIIDGQQVNISVLGGPVEPLIEQFYRNYYAGKPLPWDELDVAAPVFFEQNPADPAAHDAYFNNFISLWRNMLTIGDFLRAEAVWDRSLKPALAWELAHPGKFLHKGTPYYFWAMTAILRRDMDRGYLIIHRALEEDIRTHKQPKPNTPGFALVTLDHEKPDQAFRQWVVLQAQHVEQLLNNYNGIHHSALTMDDVKQRFLTNPPSIEALFLFTYTLARLLNIADEPPHLRTNAFAGQLELNLFFDTALVIEAVIAEKNPMKKRPDGRDMTFFDQALHLLARGGHPLGGPQLGKINGQFNANFNQAIQEALDGTITLKTGTLDRLQCDVALAYGIRNYGAHYTGTSAAVYNRFPEVEQTLFRVLFTSIEFL